MKSQKDSPLPRLPEASAKRAEKKVPSKSGNSVSQNDPSQSKWIKTGFLVVLILVLGAAYFLSKNQTKEDPTASSAQTNTATPEPNLNPNTGSLYGDIKVRLNEVIK